MADTTADRRINSLGVSFRCPECLGTDVEQLLMGYFPCNAADAGLPDLDPAELYCDAQFYCNDCEDHPDHLIREEKVEEVTTRTTSTNYCP